MTRAMILKQSLINARAPPLLNKIFVKFPTLMAALVSVLVLCIVNVLMDVLFTVVGVSMLMLIIIMATHLDSPPFFCLDTPR
jgi:hypothetical protein